ncbi:SCO family protein [Nocardioides xinjiangensis]|uniref:SCO family protein n=1 Tax=Nocardioides xinjiangensis TaxID=2817376 RepID=UPI001B303F62|nr:SCO family protein [Nocardioides sp. SYSU D00514]
MRGRRARAAVLVALLGLLAACGGGAQTASAELAGTRLDPPFEVASTPLVDTDGEAYSLTEDTDEDLTLVFFGYTHCPDICGQVMATLAGMLARLDDEQRERLEVVFVTTDPARDTQQVVADYVAAFDPAITGVTGDRADIVEVAASMKVAIGYFDAAGRELDPQDLPDTYEVDHGTQVFGISADDDVETYWGSDVSQAQLARDVTMLLDEG